MDKIERSRESQMRERERERERFIIRVERERERLRESASVIFKCVSDILKAGRIVSISDVRVILYLYTPYLESIELDLLNLYGIVFYAICRGGGGGGTIMVVGGK